MSDGTVPGEYGAKARKAGRIMIGIKDVAKKAGVSISTVSNVLNQSKYVSPELVKRVEQAAAELNYVANPIARSMKNKKTGLIGVVTADLCGVFYPYVIRGISSVAEQKGYQVILCDAKGIYGDPQAIHREFELFNRLFSSKVDGIIFVSTVKKEESEEYLQKLQSIANTHKRMPFVSLERDFTAVGIDSVYFDGFSNSQMAVQHLIDNGCRRICHITGPREMAVVLERIDGYLEALNRNGLAVEKEKMISFGDYTHQSGYLAMKKLLEKCPDVDGVFAANDQMAVGALRYLKEAGKKIPDEVKVIGYDDVFLASMVEPSLSSIHIKKRHAGIKAAAMLIEQIESGENITKPRGILMEGSLVVRSSTVSGTPQDWDLVEW